MKSNKTNQNTVFWTQIQILPQCGGDEKMASSEEEQKMGVTSNNKEGKLIPSSNDYQQPSSQILICRRKGEEEVNFGIIFCHLLKSLSSTLEPRKVPDQQSSYMTITYCFRQRMITAIFFPSFGHKIKSTLSSSFGDKVRRGDSLLLPNCHLP